MLTSSVLTSKIYTRQTGLSLHTSIGRREVFSIYTTSTNPLLRNGKFRGHSLPGKEALPKRGRLPQNYPIFRRDDSKQTVRRKSHEKCSKYIKRLAYPGNRAGIYPDSAQSTMGLSGQVCQCPSRSKILSVRRSAPTCPAITSSRLAG
jgi:hypothetical protein